MAPEPAGEVGIDQFSLLSTWAQLGWIKNYGRCRFFRRSTNCYQLKTSFFPLNWNFVRLIMLLFAGLYFWNAQHGKFEREISYVVRVCFHQAY